MKATHILRHAEKDANGMLTERGKRAAKEKHALLPRFTAVISSDADRTIVTAKLLTGVKPSIDQRASYATAPPAISKILNDLARDTGMSFLDAARKYNDPDVLRTIDERAHIFNAMIDELLNSLQEGGNALIVSHDLTIVPAMGLRGMPAESIEPLSGYIITVDAGVSSIQRLL